MIYLTADTHWGHANIIRFCNRPFKDVNEMDAALINNWNAVVKPEDTVFHLGDFCWGAANTYLSQLKGKIVLIRGSHDERTINEYGRMFYHVYDFGYELRLNETSITLCHYCMRVWPKSHYNTFHAYGHTHDRLKPEGKSWDVGVDTNGFTPVSLDKFLEIMKSRPDNLTL